MHAHGIHAHMQQPLPQQLSARDTQNAKQSAKLFSSQLESSDEASPEEASQNVDPDGQGAEYQSPPAPNPTNPTPYSTASVSGGLTPDLSVEPMLYGASGKLKYVQSNSGRKFNGSA